MKKTESKHKNARQPNGDCGMTLEEIKMRLLVNSMKIKIEQQKLLTAVLPGATPVENAVMTNITRFESIMQYVTVAVTTFKMVKNAIGFFKSLRK